MIVTDLEIDGFGVWTGLPLGPLSERLNVVYGPNEAGKTTVMQFVRAALYGFSEDRRRRYLPPVHGGRPGGRLGLESGGRRFQLERRLDEVDGTQVESLTLSNEAGQVLSPGALAAMLGGIDESIYHNVFAVGLREMQELATLSDTEASRLLYDLTTGLDRVSLGEVLRDLAGSRKAILGEARQSAELPRLIGQRRKLRHELDGLKSLTQDYGRLAREQSQLLPEIERLEQERGRLARETRVVETANLLRDKWQERISLEQQLVALGALRPLPGRVPERLDALHRRGKHYRARAAVVVRRRRGLRDQAGALGVNLVLWRQAPRIAALLDQQQWAGTLEQQIRDFDQEIAGLQTQLDAQRRGAGLLREGSTQPLPALPARTVAELRTLARSIRDGRRRFDAARNESASQQTAAATLHRQTEAAVSSVAAPDLTTAAEQAGELAAQLRRRVQLDRRLEQMALQEGELTEQGQELLERQVLPLWGLVALGGIFVLGVVLILAGLFMKSLVGSVGWALGTLGLVGTIAAVAAKFVLERSAEKQLAACERQIDMLRLQIRQAKDERTELDALLPTGGGPPTVRLEAAERRLAELEDLLPLETRTRAARQDHDTAAERAAQAKRELVEAHRRWTAALTAAGWPGKLSPREVRLAIGGSRKLRDAERRLERLRQERAQADQARRNLLARVEQLSAEAGVPIGGGAAEQLQKLRQEMARQETLVAQRNELAARSRRLKRKQAKLLKQVRLAGRRRRALLRRAGVADAAELQSVARLHEQAAQLRTRREAVEREIKAALQGGVTEEEVRGELAARPAAALETRWEDLAGRLQACEVQLRERFERRGQLQQLLSSLAADRRPADKQLELAQLEARLQTAAERWQVLAVTGMALDSVRSFYERERQPETLREASEHLHKLTQGRYRRVWTPIEGDTLYVDGDDGRSLPVDVLSQGTREQLFLSLRLALASVYARRGARLPLVFDDVFVNFDSERAKAAVALLGEYADAGHQVFLFTCHEHIVKLFKNRKVAILELPSRMAKVTTKAANRRTRKAIAAPPPIEPIKEIEPVQELPPEPMEEFVAAPPVAVRQELPSPPRPKPRAPAVEIVPPPTFDVDEVAVEATEEPPAAHRPTDAIRPIVEAPPPPTAERLEPVAPEVETPRQPLQPQLAPPRRMRSVVPRPKALGFRGFFGGGAEEFAGEFAERPDPDERWSADESPRQAGERRPSPRDSFEDVWLPIEDGQLATSPTGDDTEAA